MATHSSIIAWKSHGQRSLVGYSPWDPKESDMIEHVGKGKGYISAVVLFKNFVSKQKHLI